MQYEEKAPDQVQKERVIHLSWPSEQSEHRQCEEDTLALVVSCMINTFLKCNHVSGVADCFRDERHLQMAPEMKYRLD